MSKTYEGIFCFDLDNLQPLEELIIKLSTKG